MTKKYKIIYTPESLQHIARIKAFYNEKQKGLGTRFGTNLKVTIAAIKQNPLTHTARYDDIRFAIPKDFPYAAHYNVNGNIINIYAVLGFSEDPEKWITK
jgi:hypothetical protein